MSGAVAHIEPAAEFHTGPVEPMRYHPLAEVKAAFDRAYTQDALIWVHHYALAIHDDGSAELADRVAGHALAAEAVACMGRLSNGRERVSEKAKRQVRATFGSQCGYCGRSHEPLEFDHVRAVRQGGGSGAENLLIACQTCNRRKRDLHVLDFLASERSVRRAEAQLCIDEAARLDRLYEAVMAAREP